MTNIIDLLNNKSSSESDDDSNSDSNGKLNRKSNKITTTASKQKDDIEKDKGGRPKKELKYEKERKEVLDKLLKILNVNKENTIFYVNDLQNDENKQKQILDLESDVIKYFKHCRWSYFTRENLPNPYLSLAKSILKNMNINMSMIYHKDSTNKINMKKGIQIIFPKNII